MVGEEILQEIESTLDQLICNAEAIQGIELETLQEVELSAFEKTQESLLEHLLHMDRSFAEKSASCKFYKRKISYPLQKKLFHLERVKASYAKAMERPLTKNSLWIKRRKKKLLSSKNLS